LCLSSLLFGFFVLVFLGLDLMGSTLMESWKVSFRSIQDLDLVNFRPKDVELLVSDFQSHFLLALVDSFGVSVASRSLYEGEVIQKGSYITFPHHVIKIQDKTPLVKEKVCDVSNGFTPSEKYAGVVDPVSFEAKSRANLVVNALAIHPMVKPSISELTPPSKTWKITYSTHKDIDRGRMKAYDGTLSLSVKDGWISLLDAKGKIVGCRYKETRDNFSVGAKLHFPMHVVRMGQLISSTSTTDKCMAHADLGTASNATTDMNNHHDSSQVNHYSLSKELDYSPGLKVAKYCYTKFARSVHPSASSGHFIMVVSFGRASFKLDESSVSIALEAATGGFSGDLKVSLLCDRVFSFCVSTKSVGFHLFNLRSFACKQFKCFFHVGEEVDQIGRENFNNGKMKISNLGHL
jgi:hypothetical protein